HGNPGLLQYFIGDEVYNRIATNEFGRHGEWYGWLKVYLPTLLLGSLPWTPALFRWAIGLPASVRAWRDRDARHADRAQLLLALWVLVPLLVFCIARSRLPLYLLPLFLPLSLLVARQWQLGGRRLPHPGWIVGWALLLLALKLAAAQMATPKDAAAWAREIRARVAGPIYEVNSIDDLPRYGLHLELGAEVERVSLQPLAEPRINPDYDEDLARELAEREPDVVWLTRVERFAEARARIEALGYRVEVLGAPYSGRMIFRILPPAQS
ncbi:MAG TPA: glycosyltransferase, partial [Thermomonas sp.]|nr:glycosyltransferase [Thermomonas sp.]